MPPVEFPGRHYLLGNNEKLRESIPFHPNPKTMKRIGMLLLLVAFLPAMKAESQDEIRPESKITAVKVFKTRGQITEEADATLKAGDNLIVFSGLSQYLLPNSITVKGVGKGVIQAVTHRVTYLNRTAKPAKMLALEDSLKSLTQRLGLLSDERFVWESEQTLILANQQIKGNETGITAAGLREMAELYRVRLTEIRKGLSGIKIKEEELNKRIGEYRQELAEMNNRRSQPTQEVVVTFKADAAGKVKLALMYLVDQVGWESFYDIRVENTVDPIQFYLKANVYNRSGVDWEHIKISLSTANNAGNNNSPNLTPWYVDIYTPPVSYSLNEVSAGRTSAKAAPAPQMAYANTMDLVQEDASSTYAYDQTTTTENTLAIEFDIALPYDIPADGQPHQIDIRKMDVAGTFRHYAVPKLDRDAFLVAEVSQDLLRGKANVYFEGSFVGETFVNTDNPRDSMRISLGRDPRVQIQRAQVQDYTSKKDIGGTYTQSFGFEISVRNVKSEPVTIVLEDQIPVSRNKDIKITPMELSGGTLDEQTGRVTWVVTLKGNESKTIPLRFEAKYPKNQPVVGF